MTTTARGFAVLAALCGMLPGCTALAPQGGAVDKLTYHGDAARSGWSAAERGLTPARVASGGFGLLWESPAFDSFGAVPPRVFATPLYVDAVRVNIDGGRGAVMPIVYAATTTGFVYAVSAIAHGTTPPGTILWRQRLTAKPCSRGTYGSLSTPVIDLPAQRLYVTACDTEALWQVFALDLGSGKVATGWPVALGAAAINRPGVNRNGPGNLFPERLANLQRSALNLSPDRTRLYVDFGGEPISGWVVVVDTRAARVASAFSATAATDEGVGGMWGSGGPAIDRAGRLYVSTGSSVVNALAGKGIAGVYPDSPHNWGQSIIELADAPGTGLELIGTYTPFNYCPTGAHDMDLASSSPVLIDLDPATTSTPHLLALGGGKQGNAWLLDRDHMPGSLVQRQPCSDDSATDGSLLAPGPQPQFGKRGPLNVFGPYSEDYGMGDQAKSRTTLAHFRSADGVDYLFLTGSAKADEASTASVAPGLARLRIRTVPGRPAWLEIDHLQESLVFINPGSPFVTSNGSHDAIVWILDANRPRAASLYDASLPGPILYAVDATSMQVLWRSRAGELQVSGKYNEPTIARGRVFIGTDRLQAFGLRTP